MPVIKSNSFILWRAGHLELTSNLGENTPSYFNFQTKARQRQPLVMFFFQCPHGHHMIFTLDSWSSLKVLMASFTTRRHAGQG